jgi:excisionase family DNA binding protein
VRYASRMERKLFSSKQEIAKALSLSTRTLDKLVAAGKIPSVRVGTRRLFDPEAVTAALKTGVASPENGGLGTGTLNR